LTTLGCIDTNLFFAQLAIDTSVSASDFVIESYDGCTMDTSDTTSNEKTLLLWIDITNDENDAMDIHQVQLLNLQNIQITHKLL